MNTVKLYTVKNNEGKFFHPRMGGHTSWGTTPDYVNAAKDRDQAAGWKYNMSRTSPTPLEVAELTLSWD